MAGSAAERSRRALVAPAASFLLVAIAGACGGSSGGHDTARAAGVVAVTPGACPVTVPDTPTGAYERNGLRTILPLDGVVYAIGREPPEIENAYIGERKPDGSVATKFPWWRGPGINAHLRIGGHSVSEPRRAVSSSIARVRRTDFQPSTIVFPGAGCWKVSGRAGAARLSFVVFVFDCVAQPKRCRS